MFIIYALLAMDVYAYTPEKNCIQSQGHRNTEWFFIDFPVETYSSLICFYMWPSELRNYCQRQEYHFVVN